MVFQLHSPMYYHGKYAIYALFILTVLIHNLM